jgi:hypothetical protein
VVAVDETGLSSGATMVDQPSAEFAALKKKQNFSNSAGSEELLKVLLWSSCKIQLPIARN